MREKKCAKISLVTWDTVADIAVSDPQIALNLARWALSYEIDGVIPEEMNPLEKMMWRMIKKDIDENAKKWKEEVKRRERNHDR